MATPKYNILIERQSDGTNFGNDLHRSPSWCVAIVPYAVPAAAYSNPGERLKTKDLIILYNDCIAIDIINDKNTYIKKCTLTLKSGSEYYLNAVAPGDWVFVWIHNFDDHIQNIMSYLKSINSAPSGAFNDWNSGLKFVGRITNITSSDTITQQGVRRLDQTIIAESFVELSTSIYYTQIAQDYLTGSIAPDSTQPSNELLLTTLTTHGITSALGANLAKKFYNFFNSADKIQNIMTYPTPDIAIAFYLVIAMGIHSDWVKELLPGALGTSEGVISRAIQIPPIVAKIMGKPNARYLWQLYNIYLGVQKYRSTGRAAWERFSPQSQIFRVTSTKPGEGEVFFKSPIPLKGWVPFFPTPWDNRTLWDIIKTYLNPVSNELYTSLRINKFNRINLAITARQYPFSTNLYNYLTIHKIMHANNTYNTMKSNNMRKSNKSPQSNISEASSIPSQDEKTLNAIGSENFKAISSGGTTNVPRTMYKELPRWIIDDALVLSVNLSTSESQRCNFVIVWGSNQLLNIVGSSEQQQANAIQLYQTLQMSSGNMVMDEADIKRHGLRAAALETPFDAPLPPVTYAGVWAKLVADWMFNGHLRPFGTIVLTGLHEPISEGDNIELRGIVFHIDRVEHKVGITNGVKSFITVLSVSRGILAQSLDSANNRMLPLYPIDLPDLLHDLNYVPASTQNDSQQFITRQIPFDANIISYIKKKLGG